MQIYITLPISGTSREPKKLIPLGECSTYPKFILPRDDVITPKYCNFLLAVWIDPIFQRICTYSKHPLIRTPTWPKNLFEIANVRIIGLILKGNSRKGIKNPFELAKVWIIGRRINGCWLYSHTKNKMGVQ